jgi:CTP synthase
VYVEICEIPDHPWFLGCQFHPEFKSKPLEPHPLFAAFIGAARDQRMKRPQTAQRVRSEQFSHAD